MFINIIRSTRSIQQEYIPRFEQIKKKWKMKNILIGISLVGVSNYLYQTFWNTNLKFVHHPEAMEKEIIEFLKDIHYSPTFYIPHRLLQLGYATRVEEKMEVKYERQLFRLSDGGQLALDWSNKNVITEKPLILVTHGLTGGSDSNYIKDASQQLTNQGYQVVCFNQRGVSDCELLTSRYHFHGCTEDLKEVIDYLYKYKALNQQIYGLGFSIGANLLLKYAGQEQNNCKIDRIVSVANPYNLLTCSYNILKFRNKIYDWSITNNFKYLLEKHHHVLADNVPNKGIDLQQAFNAKNTYEFDECITRRLFGFQNPEELYKAIGCEEYLENIKVPVFCIHSKDDPIVPQDAIPFDKLTKNPNIIVALTNNGAHVEWFSGLGAERWIMKPILRYFQINQK